MEREIKEGADDFYAGGAIGWDLVASMTVIKLRKCYPQVKLHLVSCHVHCRNKALHDRKKSAENMIMSEKPQIQQSKRPSVLLPIA